MAALGAIGSAPVLVGLKEFLVVATGSLGILSETLHSGLDLIAAILTWFSVRVSDRPADSEHTYGHGRTESFSAFVEPGPPGAPHAGFPRGSGVERFLCDRPQLRHQIPA